MTTVTHSPLSSRALLVSFSQHAWGAGAVDKEAGREAADAHGADPAQIRLYKRLFPKETMEKIRKAQRKTHHMFHAFTLPWLDDGVRIVASERYLELVSMLRKEKAAQDAVVEELAQNLDREIENAKIRLNGMFKAEEYPTPEDLRSRFSINWRVFPVPDAADFRVQGIGDEDLAKIRSEISAEVSAQENAAMKYAIERLSKVVSHMVERLRAYAKDEDGKVVGGRFHGSLVENVKFRAETLPALNLTGDPELAALGKRMLEELTAYDADMLREDDLLREKTAAAAEDILEKLCAFV